MHCRKRDFKKFLRKYPVLAALSIVLVLTYWRGYCAGDKALQGSDQVPLVSLLQNNPLVSARFSSGNGAGKMQLLSHDSAPNLRIHTEKRTGKPYRISLKFATIQAVQRGDVCILRFLARTVSSKDESGTGLVYCFLEENRRPWTKSLARTIHISHSWTEVQIPFAAKLNHPVGRTQLGLGFGFLPQVVEITSLGLFKAGVGVDIGTISQLPQHSYPGQRVDAPWRAQAAARIEKHRKADIVVSVKDRTGKLVPDVEVMVEMRRHAFGFGSQIHAFIFPMKNKDAERYRDTVERLYNKVVFGNELKWRIWEKSKDAPVTARYSRKSLWFALEWLKARRIAVRGHWMTHNVLARNHVSDEVLHSPKKLRQAITYHIKDLTAAMKGHVVEWDAINHLVGWGTRTHEVVGNRAFVEFLHQMHGLDPDVKLYVNEGNVLSGGGDDSLTRRDPYAAAIRYLIDQKAPLNGIGFMGHFNGASLTPPSKLYQILERFAKFKLDLQVTEFDVDDVPEDLQKDYLRDCMTVCFSHPQMVGFMMWGFWERAQWRPQAALYRTDWSIKPAGEIWKDLVFRQWWTRASGRTAADGTYKVRGFLGSYSIKVKSPIGSKTVEIDLPHGGANVIVQIGS